jgi:hypothetical protein
MSMYCVIDIIGTNTTSCERLPLTRSTRRASRSGTFGAPRSSSRAFTSGMAASSSTARRSSLQVRAGIVDASGASHRLGFSVVIIANTEANRVCVVAQG